MISVKVGEALELDFDKETGQLRFFINNELKISKKSAGGRFIEEDSEATKRVETAADAVLTAIGVGSLQGKVLKRVMRWEWDTAKGIVPYWKVVCGRLHPKEYPYEGEQIRLVFSEDVQLSTYGSKALSEASVPEKILTQEDGEKAGLEGIKKLPANLKQHFQGDEFKKRSSKLAIIKPNTLFESEDLWSTTEGKDGLLCWVIVYTYGKDQVKLLTVYADAESGALRGGDYYSPGS